MLFRSTRAVPTVDGAPDSSAARDEAVVKSKARKRSLVANIGALAAALLLIGGALTLAWLYYEKPRRERIASYERRVAAADVAEKQAAQDEAAEAYESARDSWKAASRAYDDALEYRPQDGRALSGLARTRRKTDQIDQFQTAMADADRAKTTAEAANTVTEQDAQWTLVRDKVIVALNVFPANRDALSLRESAIARLAELERYRQLMAGATRAKAAAVAAVRTDDALTGWQSVIQGCDSALALLPESPDATALKSEAEQARDSLNAYATQIGRASCRERV